MYKCVTRCIIGQMIHSVDYNSLVSCHAVIYASTWSWSRSEGGAAKNERSGGSENWRAQQTGGWIFAVALGHGDAQCMCDNNRIYNGTRMFPFHRVHRRLDTMYGEFIR